jgi:hypothetical protein
LGASFQQVVREPLRPAATLPIRPAVSRGVLVSAARSSLQASPWACQLVLTVDAHSNHSSCLGASRLLEPRHRVEQQKRGLTDMACFAPTAVLPWLIPWIPQQLHTQCCTQLLAIALSCLSTHNSSAPARQCMPLQNACCAAPNSSAGRLTTLRSCGCATVLRTHTTPCHAQRPKTTLGCCAWCLLRIWANVAWPKKKLLGLAPQLQHPSHSALRLIRAVVWRAVGGVAGAMRRVPRGVQPEVRARVGTEWYAVYVGSSASVNRTAACR